MRSYSHDKVRSKEFPKWKTHGIELFYLIVACFLPETRTQTFSKLCFVRKYIYLSKDQHRDANSWLSKKKNSGPGKMHEKTRFSSSSSKKVVEEQPSCRVDCVTVFAVPVDPSLAGLLTAIVGSISKLRTNLSVHGIVLHLFTSSIIVLLSRRTTTKKMKSSCLSYCPILTSWNWQPGDNIIVTGWSDTSMHRQCTSVLR